MNQVSIRYTEAFFSLQGEGQYVGVPSLFFRTFGCNFRCKKFGIPRDQTVGKYNPEVEAIINGGLDRYSEFKDLPLVETGCDTYSSIYPEFKRFAKSESVETIVDQMQALLPNGTFGPNKHLILTGGEPLLGWQRAYPALFDEIKRQRLGLTHVTFETNGTQPLTKELEEYLNHSDFEVTFSISAKLPCSGEPWDQAIRPAVVKTYQHVMPGFKPYNNRSYFKFVVSTQQDIEDVHRAINEYESAGVSLPVYLMPVGGVNNVYELNERQVAEFCKNAGLRFSPRIQVSLWKNLWGT